MKKITFVLAMGAAILASCTKEAVMQPEGLKTVVTVGIDQSKTTIGDPVEGKRSIYWANGDKIVANGVTSSALADVPAESKSATFEFEGTLTAPVDYLYPASIYVDATTVALPATQSADAVLPMYGHADEVGSAQLHALTAYLNISLKKAAGEGADADKIRKVVISSATQSLSGNFTIDYTTGTLTAASGEPQALEVTFKRTLTEDPISLSVPVPAGTYDLTVKVIDEQCHCMTKTVTGKTFTAGSYATLPTLEFVPTTTEVDVEISTAEQFIAFATMWNTQEHDNEVTAALVNDIVFDETTSAAFVATGGIGTEAFLDTEDTNYYNGTFDGRGFSIKNLVTTVPVFAYTGGGAIIQNINIDSSCSITFPKGTVGSLVGRAKGVIKDCVCNADVNHAMEAGVTYLGGMFGRLVDAEVSGCTMNGSVISNTSAATTKAYRLGGIAGSVEQASTVKDCHMKGAIQWGTKSGGTGPEIKGDMLAYGGVVGHVISGSVENCSFDSGDVTADFRGVGYANRIGGVVGLVDEGCTVKNCTNKTQLYLRIRNAGDDFYTYAGGVVGENNGTVEGCTNTAQTTANCGTGTIAHGGVVGYNAGTVSESDNSGALVAPSQYTAVVTVAMGGICGINESVIEKSGNTAKVTGPTKEVCGTTGFIYVAGCVGSNSGNVSYLTNSGAIVMEPATATATLRKIIAGGVAYAKGDNSVIDNVTNTGSVTFTQTTKQNGRSSIVGGIVGVVDNAKVTVSNCINKGSVYNNNFNNTYTVAGGAIVGGIVGLATGSSTDVVTVTNCQNDGSSSATVSSRRGIQGGVVGWAQKCYVVSSSNTQSTGSITANIPAFHGGIVGVAETTEIKTCTVNENANFSSSAPATAGAVVASLDDTSVVDGCTSSCKFTCAGDNAIVGAVAGKVVDASVIKNCSLKGTYSKDSGSSYLAFGLSEIAGTGTCVTENNTIAE